MGQWKGFGMGYQRTASAHSWTELATSSKPLLLAASQLPHMSKIWIAVFPAPCQVHGAVGMKNCISWLVTHYCVNSEHCHPFVSKKLTKN